MRIRSFWLFFFLLGMTVSACKQDKPTPTGISVDPTRMQSPAERYGELFAAVQMSRVFPDGKTFVDCIPKATAAKIRAEYAHQKDDPDFRLKQFVMEFFDPPAGYSSSFQSDTSQTVEAHIETLWPVLTRKPGEETNGTLINLPNSYIVPGGRFREIYYWDSYFTMLGLQTSGEVGMIENMVGNFAFLIDSIGFIPNGNRTYFLTRSQPPFFAQMVRLLAQEKGSEVWKAYYPQLKKEYNFWMKGREQLTYSKPSFKRVVRLPEGGVLNRYWDEGDWPREEMHADDVETAEKSGRDAANVYRDIRAACESGWDFSSRWLADPEDLATIRTTEILPVDLNCLLYELEKTLAEAAVYADNEADAALYRALAEQRKEAIRRYLWNPEKGGFFDYHLPSGQSTEIVSLATIYPLYVDVATPAQAEATAKMVEQYLLQPGGLSSTNQRTGQQWDAPNGWAPLQWMAIQGFRNYGLDEIANEVTQRWVHLNRKVYKSSGKLVEKYNVMDLNLENGGGEYPVQDGFGWTNGVLIKLLSSEQGNE
jgi:alpha,alpha-trehalase